MAATHRLTPAEVHQQHPNMLIWANTVQLLLIVGVLATVAQYFLDNQLAAILATLVAIDLTRITLGQALLGLQCKDDRRDVSANFVRNLPRRWFEYGIVILPLNSLLTWYLHPSEFSGMENLATWFLSYIQDVFAILLEEISDLASGLASLTVNFLFAILIEYFAAHWIVRRAKFTQ